MKIIKVNECSFIGCPHAKEYGSYRNTVFCAIAEQMNNDMPTIPDWCKLDDASEITLKTGWLKRWRPKYFNQGPRRKSNPDNDVEYLPTNQKIKLDK